VERVQEQQQRSCSIPNSASNPSQQQQHAQLNPEAAVVVMSVTGVPLVTRSTAGEHFAMLHQAWEYIGE
jgi:hypothetical protein